MKILSDLVRKINEGKVLDEQDSLIANLPLYSIYNFATPDEMIKIITKKCKNP